MKTSEDPDPLACSGFIRFSIPTISGFSMLKHLSIEILRILVGGGGGGEGLYKRNLLSLQKHPKNQNLHIIFNLRKGQCVHNIFKILYTLLKNV